MNCIKLKDADIIAMDDASGDIVVDIDKIGKPLSNNETVCIHYEEDTEDVSHEYKVSNIDKDNAVVILKWKKQINESLLKEAPDNKMQKKIAAGNKKAAKYDSKLNKKFPNLIKREISNGKKENLNFYLQLPNGKTMKTPLQFNDIRLFYRNTNQLNPAIVNAIVTKADKTILRKGKQDYAGLNIKYSNAEAKVSSNMGDLWDKESVEQFNAIISSASPAVQKAVKAAASNDTSTKASTNTSAKSTQSGSASNVSSKQQPDNSAKTGKTANTSSDQKNGKTDNTSPDQKNKEGANSSTDKRSVKRNAGQEYSVNSYQHFLRFVHTMKPDIYDKDGQKIDPNKAIDEIKKSDLDDLLIKVQGRPYTLSAFIPYAVKSGVLNEGILVEEPVVQLDDADLVEPEEINFKDKISKGLEQERIEAENNARAEKIAELRAKYADVLSTINTSNDTLKNIDTLFDKLVPSSGKADTVAGELVRAIVRILYRDFNDGDKFFEGYGLETCGGSAQYLAENGFSDLIENILNDAYRLADDDKAYTAAITDVAKDVVEKIIEDPVLLETPNDVDSRGYNYDYIEENQPMYEYEIDASDDVTRLVEEGILNSWDLNNYVNEILSYESVYNSSRVSRPFTHHDTSVTVENLTRDGYDMLQDAIQRNIDGFWEDLVLEYADQLDIDEDSED